MKKSKNDANYPGNSPKIRFQTIITPQELECIQFLMSFLMTEAVFSTDEIGRSPQVIWALTKIHLSGLQEQYEAKMEFFLMGRVYWTIITLWSWINNFTVISSCKPLLVNPDFLEISYSTSSGISSFPSKVHPKIIKWMALTANRKQLLTNS